jgi:hypothetical protein
MNYKKVFDKFEDKNVFIKTTAVPSSIDRTQKAALNRKGNVLFNSGDIEGARRIFMTTGYSDGLTRVGDYYKSQNNLMEAFRMYWLARDKNRYGPILEQLAGLLQNLIKEDEDPFNV